MPPRPSRTQPPRYAVVLAGGFGTRFWPASRRRRPKQFLAIQNRRSMLQETVRRLVAVVPRAHLIVIASAEFRRAIRQQLPTLPPGNLLIEPAPRGTAACIALAAEWIARRHPNASMAVFPSDHAILDVRRFGRAVGRAFETAEREGCLVTFGIVPRSAETGYGYIEIGDPLRASAPRVHWALRFHEKPDAARARAYVARGRFRWNSGMFVWRIDVIRAAFARHAPAIARAAARAVTARASAARMPYRRLPVESVDVAILERADRVAVVDGNFGWSDVGSWAAMPEIWGTDAAGNALHGTGVVVDCDDTVILSPHRLVAALGMHDVIIIDSPDAVLVCRKSRAQDVRAIVDTLARRGQRRWL